MTKEVSVFISVFYVVLKLGNYYNIIEAKTQKSLVIQGFFEFKEENKTNARNTELTV